jgi:hypothetical protein
MLAEVFADSRSTWLAILLQFGFPLLLYFLDAYSRYRNRSSASRSQSEFLQVGKKPVSPFEKFESRNE